jgi:hypothetical protein
MFFALCVAPACYVCLVVDSSSKRTVEKRERSKERKKNKRKSFFYMPTLLTRFVRLVFSRARKKTREKKERKTINKK